jgi:hypothetical protein
MRIFFAVLVMFVLYSLAIFFGQPIGKWFNERPVSSTAAAAEQQHAEAPLPIVSKFTPTASSYPKAYPFWIGNHMSYIIIDEESGDRILLVDGNGMVKLSSSSWSNHSEDTPITK